MKRTTAAKLMRTHVNAYIKRLKTEGICTANTYDARTGQPCPLCKATGHWKKGCYFSYSIGCDKCLRWGCKETEYYFSCTVFTFRINALKTVAAKLRWANKLLIELDRWVSEGTSK